MADSAAKLLDPPAAEQQDTDEQPQPMDQASAGPASARPASAEQAEVLAADLLVEEISIDGMCGVY
jgi:mycofactocin precursor